MTCVRLHSETRIAALYLKAESRKSALPLDEDMHRACTGEGMAGG